MTSTNSSNLLRKRQKTLTESSNQINKTRINTAKGRGRWALLEENYTKTSEERHENNARTRRNSHNSEVCRQCETERRRSSQHHIAVHQKSFGNQQQQLRNQEHVDGWIFMNNSMGCQADICEERNSKVQSRLVNRPRPRLKTSSSTILDSMEGGNKTGRTDELRYLPISSFGARFFVLAPPVPRFQASFVVLLGIRGSVHIEFNSEKSVQLRLCFLFFQPLALLIEIRCNSASHTCSNRPHTHACKARPPTTVGWT